MKHAAKSSSKIWVLIVAGLAIMVAVLGVFALTSGSSDDSVVEENAEFETLAEESASDQVFAEAGFVSISTSYCNLSYPAEFEESLKTEISNEDGGEVIAFCATLSSGEEILLFEVSFGFEKGNKIGTLVKDGRETPVYLAVQEINVDENWSKQEVDKVFGMQEGLNAVVESIENSGSFVSDLI